MPNSGAREQQAKPYRSAAQIRSDRLRLWRGFGRVVMTLLVPGSAQLLSREKKIGRWAMRIWAGIVVSVLAWILLLFLNRTAAVAIVTFKPVTILITLVLALGGIGWAGLLLHAWKLSNPIALQPKHRLGLGAFTLALALGLSGTGLASASVVNAQSDFIGSVFAGGGDTQVKQGRYNVLLLGGDAGAGREGLRPDSIHVASVDAKTGETVLFSLPRNLEDFSFPAYSPMSKHYPDKFTCPDHACMLNAVYTAASEKPGLYPGVRDPGAIATAEAVEWITGLDINYYVLIDLDGFKALIDAVGGINLDIMKPVPVGGGSTAVHRYIEPGTNVHLNGQDALWFARSRHDSNDYERMARQKCVMNAMLNQLDPLTVTTKFTEIAGAGKQVLSSNVPAGEMNRLMDLAIKARETKVRSVSFVPPMIYPGAPDFHVIRTTVAERIAASEGVPPAPVEEPEAAAPAPASGQAPAPAQPRGQAPARPPVPAPASTNPADTDDLGVVCRAA
ncbi:LCP family protein [Granulicoccus sp. GXG6511]|uniref:LCP family protein n=1 Tax=Granulicoccus sp. GXG6511 TaxID=3381351 RepID=UPI003D7E812D